VQFGKKTKPSTHDITKNDSNKQCGDVRVGVNSHEFIVKEIEKNFEGKAIMETKRNRSPLSHAENEDSPLLKRSCSAHSTSLDNIAAIDAKTAIAASCLSATQIEQRDKLADNGLHLNTRTDAKQENDWVVVRQQKWMAQVRASWLLSFVPKGKSDYSVIQESIDSGELVLPDTLCDSFDSFQLVFGVIVNPCTYRGKVLAAVRTKDIPSVSRVLQWLGFDEPKEELLSRLVHSKNVSTLDKFNLGCIMHHDGLLRQCSEEWLDISTIDLPSNAARMLALFWKEQATNFKKEAREAQIRVEKAKDLINGFRASYTGNDSDNCDGDCPRDCTGRSSPHPRVTIDDVNEYTADAAELIEEIDECLA
jgi:hypothetical protein